MLVRIDVREDGSDQRLAQILPGNIPLQPESFAGWNNVIRRAMQKENGSAQPTQLSLRRNRGEPRLVRLNRIQKLRPDPRDLSRDKNLHGGSAFRAEPGKKRLRVARPL